MALSREERLKDRRVFRNISCLRKLRQEKFLKYFQLYYFCKQKQEISSEIELPKVAFVVKKKDVKLATDRNYLKRKFSEAYRKLKDKNPEIISILANYKYLIFFVKPDCENLAFSQLQDILLKAFNFAR